MFTLRLMPAGTAAALLLAVATALPVAAHDKLGANLNFIGDFRRNHEFVDVVKQSRRFLAIGQFDDSTPANLAPVGTDGWPTSDFRLLAMAAQQNTQNLSGTYRIVFTGQATLAVPGGGGGTISNKVFEAGTNTTTADLNFPAGAENLIIDFTATGGAVKNLRVLRPGYPLTGTPMLHTPWKTHTERFPVLRYLDWTRTNGNRDVTWANRMTPEKSRTAAYIAPWETVIDAANAMNRDAWINVPVLANDEYVTNLAILLRDRLNPNLNVYVEYGNELWNFSLRDVDLDNFFGTVFIGAQQNRDLADASPPASPLRTAYPGEGAPDSTTRGFRRVALRLMEISNIFSGVWGQAAIKTRVRPVLAGQMGNDFIVSEGLRFIDEILGVRPDIVFYGLSGAPYIFASANADSNADETPGMGVQQIVDGMNAGVTNAPNVYHYLAHAGLGAWYGLKVVAYEAGFDNFGNQNIANKRLANLDPQIRTLCQNVINTWHSFGFEHILWFNGGADSYNTQFGMWPLVEDLAVPNTPKNQCMDDILASALPAVTVGTSIAAPVAGGNYRGSANPTGGVTGNDGPFGFPGYVEYLLRTDTEGLYQVVFTGVAAPSERFRVKLNNAVEIGNVSLPATPGNAAPFSVMLRRGLNALRIERQPGTGTSWSITSFSFTLTNDATPEPFSFAAQTGVVPGSIVVSASATITGITMAAAVTVAGGEYSVGCTGTFTSVNDVISNGQTVCVRHTAPPSHVTTTTTTLTIGGVSGSFSSTTAAAPNPPRLGNISTRMQVLTGDDVMIGGFVIGGSASKRVAIVATGPSLAPFGITNPLPNPTLRLVRSSDQAVLATSDDWQTAANQADLTAAGLAPSNALEAAILADLAPGAYTAIVEGAGGVTGVSVIGVYEVSNPATPLVNISTRGRVLAGNDRMIGGFVINGTGPQVVAITATGPSLAAFGIASPLANPKITLVRSSDQVTIATNDDWQTDASAPQLQAAGFGLTHPLESAIFIALPPGAYTAIVEGVGGGTGVAVIGVYKVDCIPGSPGCVQAFLPAR